MNRKRLFALLIALMLIATWLPALAEWTYTKQKNDDGSSITIVTDENGVVRVKSYLDVDGFCNRQENYDASGTLKSYVLIEKEADEKTTHKCYDGEGVFTHAGVYYREGIVEVNENYDGSWKLTSMYRSFTLEDGTYVWERYSSERVLLGYTKTSYDEDGNWKEINKYTANDKLIETKMQSPEGVFHKQYTETGVLLEEQYTKADGSSGYKLYDENGFLYEHFNEEENRQTVKTYAPNGDSSVLEQNEEGVRIEKSEYQNGNLLKKTVYSYNENGDLDGYTITDANGQVISYTVYSLSEAGEETGFETYNQAGDLIASYVYTGSGPVGWEMDYEGNKISESYDGNVHIVEVEAPDGTITTTRGLMDETGAYITMETLVNGELVSISTYGERDPETNLPDEMIKTDLEGNVLETTLWIKDDKGNTLRTTTDAGGKVIEQRVLGPDKEYLGGFKLTDTGMEKYAYNPILGTTTTEVYDAAGNLVSVIVTDGVTVISKQDFEVAAKPQIRYVWYPNNTASTMGIAFRDVKPELTKKWYNFTPVDLSKDGEQTIPLIGGGMYIIGQVQVAVKGDEVTVTYTMRGDDRDTARRQSEFFTFFGSLNDVSAVEPEDIGAGFKFGEPLSIEKDLNGDTQVLLFVRNVVTFRDYYTNDRQLTRYWPNHPRYKEYRQQLQTIMD